ncbi:pyridoxamine 5'-phosphate oxidase family protein [Streptomyces sp. NPDC050743]|uniref:pyridoxamine 5'-phosphate oxidase family protein n=1 Tax=Streptomyces sp. NPDC050743 TaxID=3365634 RepID=UPI00379A1124
MSTPSSNLRMVELSGAEALWLLEGAELGRLVFVQREATVVRPARHVWEYGRLIVRTPVQSAALPLSATYHADDIQTAAGTGWMVTATGSAEVITDPDEAAHYRRTLPGWTHGPHDTVARIHPQTVTAFRLIRGAEKR